VVKDAPFRNIADLSGTKQSRLADGVVRRVVANVFPRNGCAYIGRARNCIIAISSIYAGFVTGTLEATVARTAINWCVGADTVVARINGTGIGIHTVHQIVTA
jgi:hypothetical protein